MFQRQIKHIEVVSITEISTVPSKLIKTYIYLIYCIWWVPGITFIRYVHS